MLFRCIALWLLALNAAQALAQNEENSAQSTYDRVETMVSNAESAFAGADMADDVSDVRLMLQEARIALTELQTDLTTGVAKLDSDLDALGEPLVDGEVDSAVADLRSAYQEERAELVRVNALARTLEERVMQLQAETAARLRQVFVRSVFQRGPPPFMPDQLAAAAERWNDRLETGRGLFANWLERSKSVGGWHASLAAALLGLALYVILVAVVQDRVANQLWRRIPGDEVTYAGRTAIAFSRMLIRLVIAAIGLFTIYWICYEVGFFGPNGRDDAAQLVRAVIFLPAAHAVSRALFSPGRPDWRLADLPDRTAGLAHGAAMTTAGLFVADQVVELAWASPEGLGAFVRVETLVASVLFATIMILLHRRVRRAADAAEAEDEGSESANAAGRAALLSTTLLLAPAIAMVAASFVGYAAFSRWMFEKAAYFALFFGAMYIFRAFLGSWVLAAVERLMFGKSRPEGDGDDLVGFWTRFSVDTLLLIAAAPVVLAIIGLQWSEIRALSLAALSGISIGGVTISPLNLISGLLVVVAVLVSTRLVQRVLDQRILPKTRLDPGVRHSFKTLIGYVGLVIAFFTGVSALGFDLSNLAIIAGALSVGIGFGLQSIVNNFVSGLILLFERPIKIGDWVVTQSGEGLVKKISVRSTEIETFDKCSIIVPNAELISASVQNWTHRDPTARAIIAVGVSYGSDPDQVREVLLSCTEGEPDVLSYPPPFVYFVDYGDSALLFELRFFIRTAHSILSVRNHMRFKVFDALKKAGIEIPFPQRDLHIRTDATKAAPAPTESAPAANDSGD